MNIQDYYRQRPEEILYHDKQVVITFSTDQAQPCLQFRDPHTMKVLFTLPFDAINQAMRQAWRVPALHMLEWEAEKKRKSQI